MIAFELFKSPVEIWNNFKLTFTPGTTEGVFMNLSRTDFSSRVSIRAIASGVLVTFSAMLLLMLLAGGMGVWGFDLSKIPQMGAVFWAWSFISWGLSLYASGYIVAIVSRSANQFDGIVHGILVWATSCFLGSIFLLVFAGNLLANLPENLASPILWGFFVADLTALGTAVVGGVNGATSEAKIEAQEEVPKRPAWGSLT